MYNTRRAKWLAIPIAGALVLAACGSDDDSGSESSEPASTDAPASTDEMADTDGQSLAGICPDTVVIQTDWNPQAEHGWIYEMIGENPNIDAGAGSVSGPLVTGGVDTGVQIEVRSGGPLIGFQTVTSQMYQDDSILLGFVYTDESIQNSEEFPTVAVMSGMEKNPQMIMWDPETYPDVETIADIGEQGILVRYFGGAAYMDFFTQTGILSEDQVDGSYDGTPSGFLADQGESAQQGFGSAEPFVYQNEVADWEGKPVAYAYINDAGWENYGQSMSVRADTLDENAACLELLVPIIQQSTVDYVNDPAETNSLIIETVDAFDNGWVYNADVAAYSVETMKNDGLLSNGPDSTIGNFDLDRVTGLIALAIPVYESLGQSPKEGLVAEDVVTNRFIDDSIGL